MPFSRTRDMSTVTGHSGSRFYYLASPQWTSRNSTNGEVRHCVDVVGNFPKPNPFDLSIITTRRPNLNGVQFSGATKVRELISYPIDLDPAPPDPRGQFPVLDEIDRSNLSWSLLGKTNISAPHVSVPTAIGELKDLPSLVKGWGADLLSRIAKGHLTWRWAIRPMVSDIRKLLMFKAAVQRRALDLSIMRVQRYTTRKASLDSSTITQFTPAVTINSTSTNAVIRADRTRIYTSKVWGTVKWKLDPSVVLPYDEAKLDDLAWRLTFGITSHELLATLWELTPWSWLIDWFLGIGQVIAATNNTVKATWAELCIMRTTSSDTTYAVLPGAWQSYFSLDGSILERHVRKERWPSTPLLPFIPSLRPLVSLKAWSILASLAALRWSPGARGAR